ncbi:uncharacterized protein LOC18426360 [Amborella trichopoda]|nr:uncharacterized protein LOC18426360 [Amborella trichopoda]|eukprot:XP_006833076.2 uncharacterized protein LOC18426360 [Amborella trichopoda]
MESQIARRRMHQIACHLLPTEELPANHVFPMNCSSYMNSVIRRRDNRMFFARQGSISQARFMQQVTIQEFEDLGNGNLSRQDTPSECSVNVLKDSHSTDPPMFARPTQKAAESSKVGDEQDCKLAAKECPMFARMDSGMNKSGVANKEKQLPDSQSRKISVAEWSPRMDIVESGSKYIITVELPGVGSRGIRVEMDDKNLVLSGTRLTQEWRDASDPVYSAPVYHMREITQGPYRAVWKLPGDVNKDGVSAEFVDGFLQIILLKI